MRLAAVYACVRILSETMASLPVVVYRQRKDGGKDRVTDHWLYGLLARKPNRFQNPFEWREMLQGHLALRGNAFCQIIANPKGEITELMPLHPDRVRMEVMDSGDFRYRVRMQNGDETVFPRGQIWHLRGLSSDGLMGMSPIELARESLGMALAAAIWSVVCIATFTFARATRSPDYQTFFRNLLGPGWIAFEVVYLLLLVLVGVRLSKGAALADLYALLSRPFWPGPAQSEWLRSAQRTGDRLRLEQLEREILAGLGLPDPYTER